MITADQSARLRPELAEEGITFPGKPLRPARLFQLMSDLVAWQIQLALVAVGYLVFAWPWPVD